MGRKTTGNREVDTVISQCDEKLRETSRDVRHLKSARNGSLAQLQTDGAVLEYVLISPLELGLSSRNLRNMSNNKSDVSFFRTDHLLGRFVERFGSESSSALKYALTFFTMNLRSSLLCGMY